MKLQYIKVFNKKDSLSKSTMEDIMSGVQTYRNPKLVHIFDKLGMIENFGMGIPRTIEAYENYDAKPEFKDTGNFFIVTLPNVNWSNTESISDPISDFGLSILRLLSKKPGLSTIGITKNLNDSKVTRDMVKNELKRNLSKYVEHRGSNKSGGYYLKQR